MSWFNVAKSINLQFSKMSVYQADNSMQYYGVTTVYVSTPEYVSSLNE